MKTAWRVAVLLFVCALSLQVYFAGRVASMRWVDPASSTFQRSEAWQGFRHGSAAPWRQRWVDAARIAPALKRAVIASEDAGFTAHRGVDWAALEKAWQRNASSRSRSDALAERLARRAAGLLPPGTPRAPRNPPTPAEPKLVGGSTITQQLAKNLFLSGERSLPRKGEELVVTFMLEALLPKQRILEIYLNSVEWGEAVFGAQAAAERYFRVDANALSPLQAAQLAVMLPAPKRFEKRPGSAYVLGRAGTVAARMNAVELP